jgi:hypothetical protein
MRRHYAVRLICLVCLSGLALGAGSGASAGSDAPLDPNAELAAIRAQIDANGYSWTAGPTSVSALSPEERAGLLGLRVPPDYPAKLRAAMGKPRHAVLDLPAAFDWTDSGGVPPVRLQLCGDCWAHCSVGAMEARLRIFDKDTTMLAVQQAVDCNYGGSSCGGGWVDDTYELYKLVGAVSEACYPYRGEDGDCTEDTCLIVAKLDTWEYIDTTVVSIKTHLMSDGPIAVGMTVYGDFYSYTGGCYEHADLADVNHGVLIVGWDDSMCGGQGAWHIRNSWGTDWGIDGFAWMRYGTCRLGTGAAILNYPPRGPARLVVEAYSVDDSSGDNDGKPDPGETVVLPLTLTNTGWVDATGVGATISTSTPGVSIVTASTTFPDVDVGASEQSAAPHPSFSVDPDVMCGQRIELNISVTCDQSSHSEGLDLFVGDAEVVFSDDAESDRGWSLVAPDDDFTDGRWRRKNPVGTYTDSMLVQPELDHTASRLAITSFVTANTWRKSPPDAADVDGGKTTLTSPPIDLSGYACAGMRYWRWYSNDMGGPADDAFVVDVSGDSGVTWTNLETLSASQAAWIPMDFELGGLVPLTDRVVFRFVASDYGEESTVEAAVDDIEIMGCPYWVDTAPPECEVTAPNGGEQLMEDSDYGVTWTASDDYGLRRTLVVVSYDGGATFPDTVGTAGPFESTLAWHTPTGDHPSCKMRIEVTDRGYNTTFDTSDSTFAIVRDPAGVARGVADLAPETVELVGCDRNPTTGSAVIRFGVPRATEVRIAIYDVRGRLVEDLYGGSVDRGYHVAVWHGMAASGARACPGIYFVRLEAEGKTQTAKVVLAR